MLTRQELIRRLSSSPSDEGISHPNPNNLSYGTTPASVLIPILNASPDRNCPDWHLLFTHRTDRVADHKGQVSFPGGRADLQDINPEATALREAHEEIGLKPQDVEIIGKLEKFPTITRYLVTPVIGLIPYPYAFHLQPEEVSRVFTIPLAWLSEPSNHEIRARQVIPDEAPGSSFTVIYFKPYQEEILWGITAEITLRLLARLIDSSRLDLE
jgi:8-oxo-dGTP pyrophosphatase MutT (NUDIX family)